MLSLLIMKSFTLHKATIVSSVTEDPWISNILLFIGKPSIYIWPTLTGKQKIQFPQQKIYELYAKHSNRWKYMTISKYMKFMKYMTSERPGNSLQLRWSELDWVKKNVWKFLLATKSEISSWNDCPYILCVSFQKVWQYLSIIQKLSQKSKICQFK